MSFKLTATAIAAITLMSGVAVAGRALLLARLAGSHRRHRRQSTVRPWAASRAPWSVRSSIHRPQRLSTYVREAPAPANIDCAGKSRGWPRHQRRSLVTPVPENPKYGYAIVNNERVIIEPSSARLFRSSIDRTRLSGAANALPLKASHSCRRYGAESFAPSVLRCCSKPQVASPVGNQSPVSALATPRRYSISVAKTTTRLCAVVRLPITRTTEAHAGIYPAHSRLIYDCPALSTYAMADAGGCEEATSGRRVGATDTSPLSTGMSVAHLNWCSSRYRSFDPTTNTYRTFEGQVRVCQPPFESRDPASTSPVAALPANTRQDGTPVATDPIARTTTHISPTLGHAWNARHRLKPRRSRRSNNRRILDQSPFCSAVRFVVSFLGTMRGIRFRRQEHRPKLGRATNRTRWMGHGERIVLLSRILPEHGISGQTCLAVSGRASSSLEFCRTRFRPAPLGADDTLGAIMRVLIVEDGPALR